MPSPKEENMENRKIITIGVVGLSQEQVEALIKGFVLTAELFGGTVDAFIEDEPDVQENIE